MTSVEVGRKKVKKKERVEKTSLKAIEDFENICMNDDIDIP